jgi:hypothetical protein
MTPAQAVRLFALREVAGCVGKDIATVRKWFVDVEGKPVDGVRQYPRGHSTQKPSLGIPESIVCKKLKEIGFSDAEIKYGLIEPHDRRHPAAEEDKPAAPAPPKKRAKRKHRKAESNGRRPRG